MKIIRKIVTVVVVLILLVVIVSLFLPRHVYVERSIMSAAPANVVFDEVNTTKNWEKWSPWHRIDRNMQITYFGPSSGSGAGYSWKSDNKNVGHGSLTITSSNADSIITDLKFEGHDPSVAGYRFTREDNGTRITWFMRSDMGMNPAGKIFGLFMDKMVGPDFDRGLHYLDSVSVQDARPAKPE